MQRLRLERFSYRFAEEVLNSKLRTKQEVEDIITSTSIDISTLSRPSFNKILREAFVAKGWKDQPHVFAMEDDPAAKMDFLKDRVGIEVGFGHASFMGIDLLKFQVSSYSALDQIDVGIYIVTTKRFQKEVWSKFTHKWEGSLTFEKIVRYLPHFKSAIQVPIYVLGIDI
jgi:Restriction endonuclease BglII